jgi:tellurium resistance protein TerZ
LVGASDAIAGTEGETAVTVNLAKGQKISLSKRDGGQLTRVRMGLGWDAAKKRGFFGGLKSQSIDLDASALLFDSSRNLVDAVWFRQLTSKDGSVRHTGDNLTGDGEGDDESIIVDLPRLPAAVTQIVFTVNSFTGQDFSQIENAFCRLVDESSGSEMARYDLSGSGRHNAQIMAKVSRADGSGWTMTAIGATATGRTFKDLLPATVGHL